MISLRYFKPQAFIVLVGILVLSLYAANVYIKSHWGVSFAVFASIGSLLSLVDKYLWNISPFKFLYKVPDFSGRYEGFLESEYRDENGKRVTKKMEQVKIIKQSGSTIVINTWTKKDDGTYSSKSLSKNAGIVQNEDSTFSLHYNYLNDGNSIEGLNMHYGTEIIKLIIDDKGKHLVGKYYTERMPFQTKGKINLSFKSGELIHEKFI